MSLIRLVENSNIVAGFTPVDMSDGANNGDWVNVSLYHRFAVVFFKADGTAGDDPTLSLSQAQDNTGTGSKDLNFTDIWVKQGTLSSIGQFERITQTADNDYTDTDAAEEEAIWIVDMSAEDLDDGFTHVQASVADVGANAQLGCLLVIAYLPRHGAEQTPSAID